MNVVYIVVGAVVLLWFVGGIYRKKQRKNKIIHVVVDSCTGCQRCLRKCHHNVLDRVSEEKRALVFVKNPDNCTACGDCLSSCKFNALELIEKNKK
ncbi:MAG: 4Fe-4S dicluster domain-containing protein [Flavobacteriaceae bacterium]|jgi:NAD-dependent dihydropyrimidine dehydrogenase PreA subunit|nr:4Fe-4S dicluster domain-containing protein [Flavobacteriaceae bacterium]